jgi:Putative zinc-finger
MLILFDGNKPLCIRTSARTLCESAHLVCSYVQRGLTPAARSAFELHLMECTACRHSVELERLPRRANGEHKTSAGSSSARRVRRRR